jgi:hypothetical protein
MVYDHLHFDKDGKQVRMTAFVEHPIFGFGKVCKLDVPVPGGGYKIGVKWDNPDHHEKSREADGGVSSEMLKVLPYTILGSPKRPMYPSAPHPGKWVSTSPAACEKPKLSRKQRRAARLIERPALAANIIKVREQAVAASAAALELEQVEHCMLELAHAENYSNKIRAVKTTHINAARQLHFAYEMQNNMQEAAKKEEMRPAIEKAAAAADARERTRIEVVKAINDKKRQDRLKNLDAQIAFEKAKKEADLNKYIATAAAKIAANAIAAVLEKARVAALWEEIFGSDEE